VNNKNNVVSQSAIYSLALYACLFFGIIRGLIVAKLLGPVLYSFRNVYGMIIEFHSFSQLGTITGMEREVPYYRGKGYEEKADIIVSTTFWLNIFYVLTASVIFILVSFVCRAKTYLNGNYCDLIFFCGLSIIAQKICELFNAKFQIDKEFYFLSRIQLISRAFGIVSCVVLTYYFSLRGFFIGFLSIDIFYILIVLTHKKKFPALVIDLKILKELIKIGLPIMASGLAYIMLRSCDKIMILSMLSEQDLGYYGLSTLAIGVIDVISSSTFSVISPNLMQEYGKTDDRNQIKHYFLEPTVILAYFLPFILASIYFGIHLPIQHYLFKYIPSIIVVKILVLGLFFLVTPTTAIAVCLAINKQLHLFYITILAVFINIFSNYLLIRFGLGLRGVALGTGISYFLLCSIILWYTMVQYGLNLIEKMKLFIFLYVPFLYSILIILTLDKLLTNNYKSFGSDFLFTIFTLLIFCVLYSPILFLIRNHSAFIKLIEKSPLSRFIKKKVNVQGVS
jgi:O-antigen/teichoic acid export membrane protein